MFAEGVIETLDGARQLFRHPLALVVLVVALLLVRDLRGTAAFTAVALFAAAAAASAAAPPHALHATMAAAYVAVVGILLAIGGALPPKALAALAVAAGAVAGLNAGLTTATPAEALGTVLVSCVLLGLAQRAWQLGSARALPPGPRQLLPRIVGAWMAAVGLLMLALEWAGRRAS